MLRLLGNAWVQRVHFLVIHLHLPQEEALRYLSPLLMPLSLC